MKKKVLLTGSNGLLGQKLIDLYLQQNEIELIATSNGKNRHPVQSGYNYATMDITNFEEVNFILNEYKPNCIIHCAAMTNVDACEKEKEECKKINIDAVENIALQCENRGIHLIHISTDFIFEGTKEMYTEEDIPKPISYYGWSKWEGENKVIQRMKNYAILRTVLVYGKVHDMSRSNIVLWALGALRKGDKIKVVNDQYRTPTLAEDLAQGCRLAEQKGATGIFNISGKDFMRIDELIKRIAKHFHLSMDNIETVSSSTLNQPAKRPPITGLSIEKARRELGYEPHSFEEGLSLVEQQLH